MAPLVPDMLIAGGAWRWAVVLRHAGRLTESTDVPVAAADALRSRLDRPEAYSVYGALMLKGAVGAATLGDYKIAHGYLTEASRAADLIGDRNDYWFALGPTNTRRVHSMVRGMLARERRSIKGDLREMAEFVGVAA